MFTGKWNLASVKDFGVSSDKWYMHAPSSQAFSVTGIKPCRREWWRCATLIKSFTFVPFEIPVSFKTNLYGFLHSSLHRDYHQVLVHFIGQTNISCAATTDA